MFQFKDLKEGFNYRAEFANRVCKLLVQNCNNDVYLAISKLTPLYDDFYECVRNIYELIFSEIPLFALYELSKHGPENYGFTEEEYEQVCYNAHQACLTYYIDSSST